MLDLRPDIRPRLRIAGLRVAVGRPLSYELWHDPQDIWFEWTAFSGRLPWLSRSCLIPSGPPRVSGAGAETSSRSADRISPTSGQIVQPGAQLVPYAPILIRSRRYCSEPARHRSPRPARRLLWPFVS